MTKLKPVCQQTQIVMIIANKPDNKIEGIISADFPHRKATVKMANPRADPNPARVPIKAPPSVCPITIIAMPILATKIATPVLRLTTSFRNIQPKIAARNGAAETTASPLQQWLSGSRRCRRNRRPQGPARQRRPASPQDKLVAMGSGQSAQTSPRKENKPN